MLNVPEIQSALVALLAAVLALCTALVTYVLVPWITRHASAAQLATARSLADVAVAYAEQFFPASANAIKKQDAVDFVQKHAPGIPKPLAENLVEAALVNLKIATGDLPIGKPVATPPSILTPGTTAPGEAAPLATSVATPAPPVPMPAPPAPTVTPDVPPPTSPPAP